MFGPSMTAAYATQALAHLARHEGGVRGIESIAARTGIPRSYLVKILHSLARAGLVTTKRGYRGGYGLARDPERITLLEILTVVDGRDAFDRCLLGLGKCSSERDCPLHSTWSEQRPKLLNRFGELTLRDVAAFPPGGSLLDYGFATKRQQDSERQVARESSRPGER